MRKALFACTLIVALPLSAPAHAILDSSEFDVCWMLSHGGDALCIATQSPTDCDCEPDVACEDAAWLFWDYCPVIEDTGNGTEDDFLLCEDAPLLVDELCGAQ